MRKRILFICGSMNQTTMLYKISKHLKDDYDCYFTAYYADGIIRKMADWGLLDNTILAGQFRANTEKFFRDKDLAVDYRGEQNNYELTVTASDLIVPKNTAGRPMVLVQEGMMVPANWMYYLVRYSGLPRVLANTTMTGLSHAYEKFCVASDGFKRLFVDKGIPADKIQVTGIPNFDNARQYLDNDFPHQDYVLAAFSSLREVFLYENRKAFIEKTLEIANGRPIIFKLHPNENKERAIREVEQYAPGHLIYPDGNTNHMIANCSALVTKFSSVLMVALALDKPVYCDLDPAFVKSLKPVQNGGTSAEVIADVCRGYLE